MPTFFSFLLRTVLVLAGAVFAASLAVAAVLAAALWAVRAAWAGLTGRPIAPLFIRIHPRRAFRETTRREQGPRSRTPRADAVPSAVKGDAVTDVQAKQRSPSMPG